MKTSILIIVSILLIAIPAIAADGVINVSSEFTVVETTDRLESILKEKGMTIFNRINHAAAAAKVDIELRDTELIIFGNPKAGSPLMKCQQSVALDLPQKAIIWEDGEAKVWISYNDPAYLVTRHSISGCETAIAKVTKALAGITKAAAAKSTE